ncbi:MAG: hybrid sensor histidine kinase/response regulator, partial [Gemmataceae bacterium]
PAGSELHEFLRPIEQASTQAAMLCQQMLAYAGKTEVVRGPLALNSLIHDMNELLRMAVSRKVEFKVDALPNLPEIEADVGQVRQILLNLVTNASEAIGDKTGTVTIRTGVGPGPAVLQRKHFCWVEVIDSGSGMPPEVLARIFEPFFTTKFTGRGLGLSAIYGIVQSYGGTITIDSILGEGTTFRVYLAPPNSEELLRTPSPVFHTPAMIRNAPRSFSSSGHFNGRAGRAIVVDDEAMVRQVAAVTLRGLGFDILECCHGGELVDAMQKDHREVKLIVIDLMMPIMDGREAVLRVRQIMPEVPIVVISGFNEEELTEQFQEGNIQGFVHKPFRPTELSQCVRSVMVRAQRSFQN